jgi:hypothetical protein
MKIVIFEETSPADKLTEHDQDSILEELGRVLRGTPKELPHLKSYRLEGGALIYIYIYAPTNSLVHGSLTIRGWDQEPD